MISVFVVLSIGFRLNYYASVVFQLCDTCKKGKVKSLYVEIWVELYEKPKFGNYFVQNLPIYFRNRKPNLQPHSASPNT